MVNILALIFVTGTVFGQEFWEKKEYLTWTNEEITRLTTNSPWAQDLKVTAGGQSVTLKITWLTALPIKQAILKDRVEAGGVLADSAKEIMGVEEQYYALGVTGLTAENAKELTEASLKMADKPEIRPANGDFQDRGRMVDVMILFTRMNPITAADKEVEVVLKVGGMEFSRKFQLNEMVYNGKLEL